MHSSDEMMSREHMVAEARRLLADVNENGQKDTDPRIVALCRRMVAAGEKARKAVRDALAVLADPHEINGPQHNAEERAAPHMDRLHEANREMDEAGARILELVRG